MNWKRFRLLLPWFTLAVYWPLLFISTHIPRLPYMQIYGRDVTLHFIAYLVLTLLFWLARYGKTRPGLRRGQLYKTVILLGLYGALDELTQQLVGRSCDFTDWLSDMGGCLTALILLFGLRRWRDWLIFYWVGLFAITHWPGQSPFVKLPAFWQQFEVAYIMTGYLVLTLLWWRTLCSPGRFMINRTIMVSTLSVLIFYALLDEVVSMLMGRGFDGSDFLSGAAGIILGVVCAAALAQHHIAAQEG